MKSNLKNWLICVIVRALHTMAQTALATIGTTAKFIGEVDWRMVASASALSGVCSILKSMALGIPEADLTIENKDEE